MSTPLSVVPDGGLAMNNKSNSGNSADAFDARATSYEEGWLGRWHAAIIEATVSKIVTVAPNAASVADIGCGTGLLLRTLAHRLDGADTLIGVDPSEPMIEAARAYAGSGDVHLHFEVGNAEALPLPDASVDVLVASTSFDHWRDQALGLRESNRVLRPGGHILLVDLISPGLWFTTVVGRRGRARTPKQVARLLSVSGFAREEWSRNSFLIRTVHAVKSAQLGAQ
jgi:ubiquinone/menaquinone biosynthesis C-methylase UbiE